MSEHLPPGYPGQGYAVSRGADQRRLASTLVLIVTFMAAEVVVGLLAGSLALLSDAGHMLTDAGALAFSLVAMRLAARPATGNRTFGLRRVEILAAQLNGLTLLVIALVVLVESVRRLISPPEVSGLPVLVVALVGVAVNLAATWQVAKAERRSLNVRGAYQHVLTDLYGFIGTAVAGAVILGTGLVRADAVASLIVVGLMLRAAYGLLRDSGRVFLEIAPADLDAAEVGREMAATPGVAEVHELHVWEITSGFPSLSAHVLVDLDHDCHETRRAIEGLLADRFGILHTTLQVDHSYERQPLTLRRHPPRERGEPPPSAGRAH